MKKYLYGIVSSEVDGIEFKVYREHIQNGPTWFSVDMSQTDKRYKDKHTKLKFKSWRDAKAILKKCPVLVTSK